MFPQPWEQQLLLPLPWHEPPLAAGASECMAVEWLARRSWVQQAAGGSAEEPSRNCLREPC